MAIFLLLIGVLLSAGIEVEELNNENCEETDRFLMTSFNLAYFPPDHSGYSMGILLGTFPSNTLVSKVIVSYSRENSR